MPFLPDSVRSSSLPPPLAQVLYCLEQGAHPHHLLRLSFIILFGLHTTVCVCVCVVMSKGPVSSTASSSLSITPGGTAAGASQSPACQASPSLALPLAQGERGSSPLHPPFSHFFSSFQTSIFLLSDLVFYPPPKKKKNNSEYKLSLNASLFISHVATSLKMHICVGFCCHSEDRTRRCNSRTIAPSECAPPHVCPHRLCNHHSQAGARGRKFSTRAH